MLIAIYTLVAFGFVLADNSVGGCLINGNGQSNITCDNNTNDVITSPAAGTSASSYGLSPGEVGGIVVGSLAMVFALVPALVTCINPETRVDGTKVWNYRRAGVYKLVEGFTLNFGFGLLVRLQEYMEGFVKNGGLWNWS